MRRFSIFMASFALAIAIFVSNWPLSIVCLAILIYVLEDTYRPGGY